MKTTSTKNFWRPAVGLSSLILGLIGLLPAQQSSAQVALGTSPYVQNFNSLGSGLPAGWSVRSLANPANFGTAGIFSSTPVAWNSSAVNFENLASCNAPAAAGNSSSAQNASSDRALGVRKAASSGNPGGAFVFQIANTMGKSNFAMNFKLMQLDPTNEHGQTVTWRVDYGFGANPTSFTSASSVSPSPLKTKLNPTAWGSQDVTVNFGSALNDYNGVVTIRIYSNALTSASGANNTNKNPNSAIDDVSLSWNTLQLMCPANMTVYTSPSSCNGVGTYLTQNNQADMDDDMGYVFSGATTGSGAGTGSGSIFNLGVTTVTLNADHESTSNNHSSANINLNNNSEDGSGNGNSSSNGNGNSSSNGNGNSDANGNSNGNSNSNSNNESGDQSASSGAIHTDISGTCSFTVTVVDNIAPVVSAASGMTVQCDGAGNTAALNAWMASHGGASASDNCGYTWSSSLGNMVASCGGAGSRTAVFTATDGSGNATSTSATFTIIDTQAPALSASASDYEAECDGAGNGAELAAWLANHGGAVASDACSGVTWSDDFDALSDDCGASGSATVTFTATDACGNATSTTASFIIHDTTAPSMTSASTMVVECSGHSNEGGNNNNGGGEGEGNNQNHDSSNFNSHNDDASPEAALAAWLANHGGATASDLCSGVTWSDNYSGLSNGCGATGSATVTFTATDACGNSSSTTASFIIQDTTAPTLSEASDVTTECSAADNQDNHGDGEGNGNHFGNDNHSSAHFNGEGEGNNNGEGNSQGQGEGNGNGEGSAYGYGEAGLAAWLADHGGARASDECSSVTWSNDYEGLHHSCGSTGSATVTFTATDACGNSSHTTATFTIRDTQAPTIACAADVFVCWEDSTIALLSPASSDNCSSVTVSNDRPEVFPAPASGSTTTNVTWTSTDACGNHSSCVQHVTRNSRINGDIAVNMLPGYCQGNMVILTMTSSGGTGAHHYSWSASSGAVLTDASSNVVTVANPGHYEVTVTDEFTPACSRTFPIDINIAPWTMLSNYTILGSTDVHLHGYNTIMNGGVGATAAAMPAGTGSGNGSGCNGGRVKFHQHSAATASSTFAIAKCIEVDGTSSVSTQLAGTPANVPMPLFDAGVVVPGTASSVTVASNTSVTLSGTLYGNISVKSGATLTFLHATVDCKSITLEKGAKMRGDKPCTRIRMEGNLHIGEGAIVNPAADAHDFAIYIEAVNNNGSGGNGGSGNGGGSGGSGSDANATIAVAQSAIVRSFIYAPSGKMEVHGPGGNGYPGTGSGSGVHSTASATSMTGMFIAKTVASHGRTNWDWNTVCATCNYDLRGSVNNEAVITTNGGANQMLENYPNPFSGNTEIRFSMTKNSIVTLNIYDVAGNLIETAFDGKVKGGEENKVTFSGSTLADGLYFYQLSSGDQLWTGKMIVLH